MQKRMASITKRITGTHLGIAVLLLFFAGQCFADSFNQDCTNNQNCFNEGDYIYEGGQDLIDLYNMSGTTNLNSADDSWSGTVNLSRNFNRWGHTWGAARMSTNGCLGFVGATTVNTNQWAKNCSDYTPQALPYQNYTLYPLWTDLIRGNNSKMLYKSFDDYVVFGWYYMKEYNRASSNSFEVILWANSTYEFRYRELDIQNHDVLIGEQGRGSSGEHKTYLFYNDGQNGYNTFDQFLAGYGGPDIENGGSLYSEGLTLAQQCAIDPLYDSSCTGYADAYFNQQCGLDALYDEQCPGYAAAYLTQQCNIDSLYDEQCPGYTSAYFDLQCEMDALYDSQCEGYWEELAYQESLQEEEDYGMGEDDFAMYGYDDQEEYEEQMYGYDNDDYGYEEFDYAQGDMGVEVVMVEEEVFETYMDEQFGEEWETFTDEEWYEIDVEEFGQEQVDEWYGSDVEFTEEGTLLFESVDVPLPEDELLAQLDNTDVYILEEQVGVEIFREEEWEPEENEEIEDEILEEFEEITEEVFEEFIEEIEVEVLEDEAFEELISEDELDSLLNEETEEIFEEKEELIEEETALDETVEEITPAEVKDEKKDSRPSRSAMVVAKLKKELGAAASVVSQQIQSGSAPSGGSSGGGASSQGSSSGSSSSQVAQSTGDSFVQEQQEQLTGTLQVDVQVEVVDSGPAVSAFEVAEQQQEQAQQQEFTFESNDSFGGGQQEFADRFDEAFSSGQSLGQFLSNEAPDFSSFDVAPPSVSEKRATKAVENLAERVGEEAAQEQLAAQFEANQESGGFDDQTVAVAVIGYKEGFSAYTGMEQINDQQNWYQVKALYTNATISDNRGSFYRMAGSTEQKLKTMINSQYKEN